ncbi:HAD-IIIA family hydrolase [Streptomyces ipomoeae]|uniref:D-glycero-alpha-D-manno-heptose-1,7-bisphosphate 7-phosphatase n=1 Tax=Streptomyces ipomoeae TaxID=103232 RepID=UPI00215C266B|nr:HAD-IIIA family hydrolase [Streptomyces ipomoeae]MDX2820202.1 HAD-IIIA family hydrolase [Streptomyces ipomoeae]MDX2874918.1 HAD-IIIA family hydrolase [Streptomyces ipomoeae]
MNRHALGHAVGEPDASRPTPSPTAQEPNTSRPTSGLLPRRPTRKAATALRPAPVMAAVLFDRDGTLVEDVPYNGDPELVCPVPGARRALELLRAEGIATGVVSNQSGIGRGLLTDADVRGVNARADALLGGLGTWVYCPHLPEAGCVCRKPRPGLVLEAARRLGVAPRDCVVIGDIGADLEAARAAGARGVLVPTAATRRAEVEAAPRTAPDLLTAVRALLVEARGGRS